MKTLKRIFVWLSSLKVAILLLFLIAISSGVGTLIPQGEASTKYIEIYKNNPWLGFIKGELILFLQLDHIYSSVWFLSLLAWLSLALIICSYRRQFPILQKSLQWIDYKYPRQINKLTIAHSIAIQPSNEGLNDLANHLELKGWVVKKNPGRFAARKGVVGRIGPPLIHFGMILLMTGAALGAIQGEKIEQFLIPNGSFTITDQNKVKQLTLKLKDFRISRDPQGRTEQFTSKLELLDANNQKAELHEVHLFCQHLSKLPWSNHLA